MNYIIKQKASGKFLKVIKSKNQTTDEWVDDKSEATCFTDLVSASKESARLCGTDVPGNELKFSSGEAVGTINYPVKIIALI